MTTALNALSPPMSLQLLGMSSLPSVRHAVKTHREREERRVRNRFHNLLLLGLPSNVDDMTLAKRLGHHEMVPEEFGWLMGRKT